MPLDPNVKMLIDQMAAIGAPPVHEMSVAEARSGMDAMVMMMGAGEEVARVEFQRVAAKSPGGDPDAIQPGLNDGSKKAGIPPR